MANHDLYPDSQDSIASGTFRPPNLPDSRSWAAVAVLLALWLVFAVDFIVRTSHVSIDGVRYFTVFDDGMIAMRYAKNLVQHHALVWNLGDRVEGFTDPLWTLIMAGAIWLFGVHLAPLAIQILGALVCMALFILFFRLGVRTEAGFVGTLVSVLFLMLSYPLSFWGLAGMEACAISLIYAVVLALQYSFENRRRGNPLLWHALLIATAYFLRPDGWLAIVPFFAACWIDSVKTKKYRLALVAVLLPLLVVVALQVARVAYYGEWVPNTYVLKVQGYSLALRLKNGLAYLTPFFQQNLVPLGLVALSLVSKKRVAFQNLAAVSIILAYQLYVGGDPWSYWRQILPVYVAASFSVLLLFEHLNTLGRQKRDDALRFSRPATALLLFLALLPAALYEYVYLTNGSIDSTPRRPLVTAYFIAAVLLVTLLGTDRLPVFVRSKSPTFFNLAKVLIVIVVAYSLLLGNLVFKDDFGRRAPATFDRQACLIDKAVLANRLFGPGKTHHVIFAGTYPYYVEGTMIDALGKSDWAIARYPVDEKVSWGGMSGVPGHAKYNFRDSILQRKPDIVVERAAWGRQDVSPDMRDSYALIKSDGVSLCVRKQLALTQTALVQGSCPAEFLETDPSPKSANRAAGL